MRCEHLLDEIKDAEFLASEPINSLWFTPFKPGDLISVCAKCRAVVLEQDWAARMKCPVCSKDKKLYFYDTHQLLWREKVMLEGVLIDRPVRPLRSRRLSGDGTERPAISACIQEYMQQSLIELILAAICLASYLIFIISGG